MLLEKQLLKETQALRKNAAALVATAEMGYCDYVLYTSLLTSYRLLTRRIGRHADLFVISDGPTRDQALTGNAKEILGKLNALEASLKIGGLSSIEDLISVAVLSDFLGQAETLIAKKHMLPAAVLLRAVLEERLRELCTLHKCIPAAAKPTINHFKDELVRAGIFDALDSKKVDVLAGVGNAAAHALPTFRADDVPHMMDGVRDLLKRFAV